MKYLRIPSTAPLASWTDKDAVRMEWNVYVHKPQGRGAYATATEGAATPGSFQTCHPGSRMAKRVDIVGPATLKKKKVALLAVLQELARTEAVTFGDYTRAAIAVDGAHAIES